MTNETYSLLEMLQKEEFPISLLRHGSQHCYHPAALWFLVITLLVLSLGTRRMQSWDNLVSVRAIKASGYMYITVATYREILEAFLPSFL